MLIFEYALKWFAKLKPKDKGNSLESASAIESHCL